jgi:hypothetical protein
VERRPVAKRSRLANTIVDSDSEVERYASGSEADECGASDQTPASQDYDQSRSSFVFTPLSSCDDYYSGEFNCFASVAEDEDSSDPLRSCDDVSSSPHGCFSCPSSFEELGQTRDCGRKEKVSGKHLQSSGGSEAGPADTLRNGMHIEEVVHSRGVHNIQASVADRQGSGNVGNRETEPSGGRGPQGKRWVFTCNNPTEANEKALQEGDHQYAVWQTERGDSGTTHLQGLICFKSRERLTSLRRRFGPWHFELMRGTLLQAEAYCTKDDSRVGDASTIRRKGIKPAEQGSRTDLDALAITIREAKSERDIFEAEPGAYLKWSTGIKRARALFQGKRLWKTEVIWCFGATGSGKSRWCQSEAPDAYWKAPSHYWWDGYEGSDDVIVDDYRGDFCKFSELLRLLDRYPLQIQVKGATCEFLAKRIFITSPEHPVDIWRSRSEEDIFQLVRRLSTVYKFVNGEKTVVPSMKEAQPPNILFNPRK